MADEFEAAEKEVARETADEISKMRQKEAQFKAMMSVFVADLPGEIDMGFDKTVKEFSDKVVAQVLDRDQRIEFNREVAASTQATVVSLI